MCRRGEASARCYPGCEDEKVCATSNATGTFSPSRTALLVLAHHHVFRFRVASRCMIGAMPSRRPVNFTLAVFPDAGLPLGVGAAPALFGTARFGSSSCGNLGGDRHRP